MKKIVYIAIISLSMVLIFPLNKCFGLSDNFKFVIDTIGVPRYNVLGQEINEDVYYTYNIFVYSSPTNVSNNPNQRFKEVQGFGKWTKGGGKYNGTGVRGEYYILGTTYSGSYVDNVYFPVDAIPETIPSYWNFTEINGALNSWSNYNICKYVEQIDYMKNTQMLFDSDNFNTPPTGKMSLKEYGITAGKIGLNKAMLNTPSTWKTMGVISTKRINNKGQVRNAIFATAPIAASAGVLSNIEVKGTYNLDENSEELKIPIKFGSKAINLNNYANEKHIKEICSIIYIDNQEVARISNSKAIEVSKLTDFIVNRQKYNPGSYNLNIKVVSYLYTEFYVDGLMQDTIQKNITINIIPKKIAPVKDIKLGTVSKVDNDTFIKPLIKTANTKSVNSYGIVEKNRHLAINLLVNIKKEDISNLNILLNKKEVKFNALKQKDNSIILEILVDEKMPNTLASWSYLRDAKNNYFNVDFNDVGNRLGNPNSLKINLSVRDKVYEYEALFDTIDDFKLNINYMFKNNVINYNELDEKINIESWI